MNTKISKTTWVDAANYQYDIYRMSIRTNFDDGTASRFSINIAATSEDEAKEFMNGIINKHIGLVSEDYNKFYEAVVADVTSDKTQQKFFMTEDEKKAKDFETLARLKAEGLI